MNPPEMTKHNIVFNRLMQICSPPKHYSLKEIENLVEMTTFYDSEVKAILKVLNDFDHNIHSEPVFKYLLEHFKIRTDFQKIISSILLEYTVDSERKSATRILITYYQPMIDIIKIREEKKIAEENRLAENRLAEEAFKKHLEVEARVAEAKSLEDEKKKKPADLGVKEAELKSEAETFKQVTIKYTPTKELTIHLKLFNGKIMPKSLDTYFSYNTLNTYLDGIVQFNECYIKENVFPNPFVDGHYVKYIVVNSAHGLMWGFREITGIGIVLAKIVIC